MPTFLSHAQRSQMSARQLSQGFMGWFITQAILLVSYRWELVNCRLVVNDTLRFTREPWGQKTP